MQKGTKIKSNVSKRILIVHEVRKQAINCDGKSSSGKDCCFQTDYLVSQEGDNSNVLSFWLGHDDFEIIS